MSPSRTVTHSPLSRIRVHAHKSQSITAFPSPPSPHLHSATQPVRGSAPRVCLGREGLGRGGPRPRPASPQSSREALSGALPRWEGWSENSVVKKQRRREKISLLPAMSPSRSQQKVSPHRSSCSQPCGLAAGIWLLSHSAYPSPSSHSGGTPPPPLCRNEEAGSRGADPFSAPPLRGCARRVPGARLGSPRALARGPTP